MLDSASFWTDIKKLEEQLVKSPDSYCFARLSEVYLKVGLVDDALHFARQGVQKHPDYLSGQRALALACYTKGLNNEALTALQVVTKALPEDVSAQKLLGRLSAEGGNHAEAIRAFRTALEFAPDDQECRLELESLERSVGLLESGLEAERDDEEIIEDLEIVEECDDFEEKQTSISDVPFKETHPEQGVQHHDPLSTSTLAELYVRQGFIHKALEIYRTMLLENPLDRVAETRVIELEALDSHSSEPDFDETCSFEAENEFEDEPESAIFSMPLEVITPVAKSVELPQPECLSEVESPYAFTDKEEMSSAASSLLSQGVADNAVATLDGWLENIRRIKSCR